MMVMVALMVPVVVLMVVAAVVVVAVSVGVPVVVLMVVAAVVVVAVSVMVVVVTVSVVVVIAMTVMFAHASGGSEIAGEVLLQGLFDTSRGTQDDVDALTTKQVNRPGAHPAGDHRVGALLAEERRKRPRYVRRRIQGIAGDDLAVGHRDRHKKPAVPKVLFDRRSVVTRKGDGFRFRRLLVHLHSVRFPTHTRRATR